jgi:hypothetical protein
MTDRPPTGERRRLWIPHQHGAWALLAVPLLLGVAASRPVGWQLALAGAAFAAYIASAALQAWLRGRRRGPQVPSIVVFGAIAGVLGIALAVAFPPLLLALVVLVPTAVLTFGGARPGTRRDLANSVLQSVQSLVLTPAAAYVTGDADPATVARATVVSAAYLVSALLLVRSVLRERGNDRFLALSVGYHVALVPVAALTLPPAWLALAALFAGRAVGLPWVQRRWARGGRALKPIHVGIVEIVTSVAIVVVAFVAGYGT